MTIADKLEGLLPADGIERTANHEIIAEAVGWLRAQQATLDVSAEWATTAMSALDKAGVSLGKAKRKLIDTALCAFATGCIASAIFVVLV